MTPSTSLRFKRLPLNIFFIPCALVILKLEGGRRRCLRVDYILLGELHQLEDVRTSYMSGLWDLFLLQKI